MSISRLISVAPMLDWTDRHARYLMRIISPHALLYSEMVTTGAILHGDTKRFLAFDPFENPVALQLGGNNPEKLAACAILGEDYGYAEINLNVGCPSDRVQSGAFGACLMLQPSLVADCINEMQNKVKIPVTIKCRIGVDLRDSYEELFNFVQINQAAGCNIFIIHARKAWLQGLSPKQNREIPPLQYEVVQQIKKDFPSITIILNGGLKDIATITTQLTSLDGVMIGREAYSNPFFLKKLEETFFATNASLTRFAIVERYIPYVLQQLQQNTRLSNLIRPLLGLFQGEKGGRRWRRVLSENAHLPMADSQLIQTALAEVL
jgi:tRNA-dihydrouridine synthase A